MIHPLIASNESLKLTIDCAIVNIRMSAVRYGANWLYCGVDVSGDFSILTDGPKH